MEKSKRIVTKAGDVFCAEIDGKYKCFFQYIINDVVQKKNSNVVRVFKRRYPMDYKPCIEDIVSDEVLFYLHTDIRDGIMNDAWYKVGDSKKSGEEDCRKILFGATSPVSYGPGRSIECVEPEENWRILHIGEDAVFLGRLPKEYAGKIEDGAIIPYYYLLMRMKLGFDTDWHSYIYEFGIRHRVALPGADIYVKKGYDYYSTQTFFHFHGKGIARLVEIAYDGKVTRMTTDDIAASNHKMSRLEFSDIKWIHKDFIKEEEFERIWNGEMKIQ